MPTILLSTEIAAPIERCFDLARSIDFHTHSMGATGERAVAGVTSGLIGPGQEVTWRARHFGVTQDLTSRIVEFDRPHAFADEQVRGAFKSFRHVHRFEPRGEGRTLVTDEFRRTRLASLLRPLRIPFQNTHLIRGLSAPARKIYILTSSYRLPAASSRLHFL